MVPLVEEFFYQEGLGRGPRADIAIDRPLSRSTITRRQTSLRSSCARPARRNSNLWCTRSKNHCSAPRRAGSCSNRGVSLCLRGTLVLLMLVIIGKSSVSTRRIAPRHLVLSSIQSRCDILPEKTTAQLHRNCAAAVAVHITRRCVGWEVVYPQWKCCRGMPDQEGFTLMT